MKGPAHTDPLARRIASGLLLAAGAAAATGTVAQSRWIHSVLVPGEVEYDSNPNMSPGGSPGVTFTRLTPTFNSRYVLDTDEFGVEAALAATKSSRPDVAEDRLDPRLRGVWKHFGPRDNTELAVQLDRSAFRDLGVTEQVPAGVDGTRTLFGVTGRWAHEFDARTSVETELGQEWERFSGATTPDFRRSSATVRLNRAHDERTNWYGLVNGQAYRSTSGGGAPGIPAAGARSSAVGALAGLNLELSPSFKVDAGAGPVHFTGPQSRTGWQGIAKATYTGERWSAGVEVSRAPVVNATVGGLVQQDEAKVQLRYDTGPLSRLEAEAGHAREQASRTSRSLATVTWTHQWTPSWQVGVRAGVQKQDGPLGNATSNRIGVLFVYTAPDL